MWLYEYEVCMNILYYQDSLRYIFYGVAVSTKGYQHIKLKISINAM